MFSSIIDAQEAFPEMDLAVLKELYIQAKKSKPVLFEMCFQMANPGAGDNQELQNALQMDQ